MSVWGFQAISPERDDVTIDMIVEYAMSKIMECVKARDFRAAQAQMKYLYTIFVYAAIREEMHSFFQTPIIRTHE